MKKTIYFSLVAFLFVMGCAKDDDFTVNPDENQLKSARIATPINPWPTAWAVAFKDVNSMLETALYYPPEVGEDLPSFSFTQFPAYDFTPYLINGEKEYDRANYDLMTHFVYISPEAVTGAMIEFIYPHIEYFIPHMNNINQQRVYTVNNTDNQTVITCTVDLSKGRNPMFCFLVKVDCSKGNSGFANIWTDMKVNGVSVKGTIKNKVFACN